MRRLIPILALVLIAGCDSLGITGQKKDLRVVNRVLIDPAPGIYPRWYAEAERCVERTGNFDAVRWHRADEIWLDGKQIAGVLEFPDDITIAVPNVHRMATVKHEAIHHILQQGDELHGTELMLRCSNEQVWPWD